MWQRRISRWTGLIIPPAVVPTICVLQGLGLFRTLPGLILILIEVAFGLSFSIPRSGAVTVIVVQSRCHRWSGSCSCAAVSWPDSPRGR